MLALLLRRGIYCMSGGSLPSARHTILLIAFAYQGIIARRVPSAGNVNTRLPDAVKPTTMHVLVCTHERVRYMEVLCTTAVSYNTMMICIRYVRRRPILTRILRGDALSNYHTWNDIKTTPTRQTRLARRENQCFDGCVPAPRYPYTPEYVSRGAADTL